jgi:demethylmenaquinone methyltransferase/2-methoxy-6-polyprenyl-1,4-benzoquinol methylase
MLSAALSKDKDSRVAFVCGEAGSLPFPSGTFGCIGTSFAFRNLSYKNPGTPQYLAETLRVLEDGGRFVIVETSQPGNRLVRGLFHVYLRYFVRSVGAWLSGNRPAYNYLAESARRFYTTAELRRLLLDAGFSRVSSQDLLFGAVAIHTAVK